ncbi:MAG TPA: DUF2306 domain-containing protein [Propionibacteriaceae bacterium]|nr:DUF2306 domain-containing protein [Propionibacteriaceae bacterium]
MISAIDRSRRSSAAARVRSRRPVLIFIGVLIGIVLTSYGFRIATDAPFLVTGTDPEPEDFEARYVAHPWLAYLHMTPGVLYLLGAPLQLSERFRTKHYTAHRRLGRVLVTAALVSVSLALIFGLRFPWGGTPEAIATAVFGCWFLACLLLAVRAIRRGEVSIHRRWMIRAFAVGVGVGTIRIWIGLLLGTGLLDFHDTFAVAFWIGLSLNVLAAEWWIRTRPDKTG